VVTTLPTPANPRRRAIYPTGVPDATGYVFWMLNSTVPGGGYNPSGNSSFTLQYVSLADPATVHDVETQPVPARGFAPMDIGFARWFRGRIALSYGAYGPDGHVQVKEFDPTLPGAAPRLVTTDGVSKIDPWSMTWRGGDLLIPGDDGTATTDVYQRQPGAGTFSLVEQITPVESRLANPSWAQSNQSIVFDSLLYTAYQVNDQGAGFFGTVTSTGEIWLSTVLQSPPVETQWLLSETSDPAVAALAKSEPEPYVGSRRVWVFYSAVPSGSSFLTSTWQLRRAATPIGVRR
jgi:hypothetical protein